MLLAVYPVEEGGVHLLSERLRLGNVPHRDLALCASYVATLDGYDRTILLQAVAKAALLGRRSLLPRLPSELAGEKVAVNDIRSARTTRRTTVYARYTLSVPPITVLHADCPRPYDVIAYPVAPGEVLRLRDAVLTVGSDVLQSQGRYYVDNNAWPGARSQNLVNDSRLLALNKDRAIVATSDQVIEHVDQAIWLGFPMLENWGHWVYEGLLRLEVLAQEVDFADLPILVPASVPHSFFEVAQTVFPAARFRQVPHGSILAIDECVYSPLRTYHAHNVFWSPDDEKLRLNGEPQVGMAFRKRVRRELGWSPDRSVPKQRIYLDRSLASYRTSRNAERMRSIAERAGFKVVDPGGLSPVEQLTMFLEAGAVWGQTGSGFFLTPLAAEGCSVMMVGSDFSQDWAGLALVVQRNTLNAPVFVLGERDFVAPGFSERLYHQDFTLSEEAWRHITQWCDTH